MDEKIKEMQNILRQKLRTKTFDIPRIIHVETRARCNATCAFCPANIKTDTRTDIYTSEDLIEKIINELKAVDYPNRLSFYNNNEPFIDKRIFEIIRRAREKLPKAYLELKSNGRSLNTDKIIEVFNAGLDLLYINDYSENGEHNKNVVKIMDELGKIRRFKGHFDYCNRHYYDRILIGLRNINEIKNTRAGTSPNREQLQNSLAIPCFRPFEMMTISPEGKVSICSEDFYYSLNMGNVNNENLFDIWRSSKWQTFRHKLLEGERNCADACSKCDYKGFTYEMLREYDVIKEGENEKYPLRRTGKFHAFKSGINRIKKTIPVGA